MAGGRSGSSALLWVVVGFCLGICATLVTLMVVDRGPSSDRAEASAVSHARPTVAAIHPVKAPSAAAALSPSDAAAQAAVDAQVAEDAAAAGMTSRRAPSGPPQQP